MVLSTLGSGNLSTSLPAAPEAESPKANVSNSGTSKVKGVESKEMMAPMQQPTGVFNLTGLPMKQAGGRPPIGKHPELAGRHPAPAGKHPELRSFKRPPSMGCCHGDDFDCHGQPFPKPPTLDLVLTSPELELMAKRIPKPGLEIDDFNPKRAIPTLDESLKYEAQWLEKREELKEKFPKAPGTGYQLRPELKAVKDLVGEVAPGKNIIQILHDGLGFLTLSELNSHTVGGQSAFKQVAPDLYGTYCGDSPSGILTPLMVGTVTFSFPGWYASLTGKNLYLSQMTNNLAESSKQWREQFPFYSPHVADGPLLNTFGMQQLAGGEQGVDTHAITKWADLEAEVLQRGGACLDIAKTQAHAEEVYDRAYRKTGYTNPEDGPQSGYAHKGSMFHTGGYDQGDQPGTLNHAFKARDMSMGNHYEFYENFPYEKRGYTDTHHQHFQDMIAGLDKVERTRMINTYRLGTELTLESVKGGRGSFAMFSEFKVDHSGHYHFLRGGHTMRNPDNVHFVRTWNKRHKKLEETLPKGTVIIEHSDHGGDPTGGYAHYHGDVSAHGQKNTATQRTGTFGIHILGHQIDPASKVQGVSIDDIPLIAMAARGGESKGRLELSESEKYTVSGELSIDITSNQALARDEDYLYSPNYRPKTEQDLLYKLFVKSARTPTTKKIFEPHLGNIGIFEQSAIGRDALKQVPEYVEAVRATPAYGELVADVRKYEMQKLHLVSELKKNRDSGAGFADFSDRDIKFLMDLSLGEGFGDVAHMQDKGWDNVTEDSMLRTLFNLMSRVTKRGDKGIDVKSYPQQPVNYQPEIANGLSWDSRTLDKALEHESNMMFVPQAESVANTHPTSA